MPQRHIPGRPFTLEAERLSAAAPPGADGEATNQTGNFPQTLSFLVSYSAAAARSIRIGAIRVLDFDHKAGISFFRDGKCQAHPRGEAFADDVDKEITILKIRILKKLKFWPAKSSGYEDFASRLRSEKKTRPAFEFPPFLKIETPMEEDRRRDFRKPGENSIVLRFSARGDSPADESVLSAMAKNLSPGGVKIAAGQTLPPDAVLKVELELPELQKTVTLRGKVKWVNRVGEEKQFELGLEFVDPPSEDLLSLLEHTYKE